MKKLLKIGGILAIVGILALTYGWFFVYNKPHKNYEKAQADFKISAEECYNTYASGDADASRYLDKVLQIEGIPTSIENNDSSVVVVFAYNSGMFGDEGIRCTMLENYKQSTVQLNPTDMVRIKGYCSGYNGTDVILEHCSIVKQ